MQWIRLPSTPTWRLYAGLYAWCVSALVSTAAVAAPAAYTTQLLPTLGGRNCGAYAINNAGQVAGCSVRADDGLPRVVRWTSGIAEDLGDADVGTESRAYAINALGQLAGYIKNSTLGKRASIWTGTQLSILGSSESEAHGINDAGQVSGYMIIPGVGNHAVIWAGGSVVDLGAFGPYGSSASGINNSGQVVGLSNVPHRVQPGRIINHAVWWAGGGATDLTPLQQYTSVAYAISDAGVAVGYVSPRSSAFPQAAMWKGGRPHTIALAYPTGHYYSQAYAVNAKGQAVGMSYHVDGGGGAALWDGRDAIDLNDVLDPALKAAGWVLTDAQGINDNGWIVGNAFNVQTSRGQPFILVPRTVP